jgi:hypothetical protein
MGGGIRKVVVDYEDGVGVSSDRGIVAVPVSVQQLER